MAIATGKRTYKRPSKRKYNFNKGLHLATANGTTCGSKSEHSTEDITKVTCFMCKPYRRA